MLYLQPVVHTVADLQELMFADLRIDEEDFAKLNREDLLFLAPRYRRDTLRCLAQLLKEKKS
ncbi:MAG: hypothetical protein VZQ81_07095 [Succiniclasticum sp.]|jgi:hypothetical protein|nr:hypothetical protein [Succiniclasticum sp.]MEE3479771.1 hypothetical protein [Succiniclasticum sp.]